jgi:hypothetical protein
MANAINQVASIVNVSTNKNISVDTRTIGKQRLKNTDFQMTAGYIEVANAVLVSAGQVITAPLYSFGLLYKYPPIVTATIINNNNSDASNDATVIISNVTTSDVQFKVRFSTAGTASVGLNIIAVGIPTSVATTA